MRSSLKKVVLDELHWAPSPTGAPGCYGKKIFNYSAQCLGRDGTAGDYTTLYKFDPGAQYPSFRIAEGYCELGVMRGSLLINEELFEEGDWVQLPQGELGWALGSNIGAEVLGIVRGRIVLVDQVPDHKED